MTTSPKVLRKEQGFIDKAWLFLVLCVGYPFALVILLTSRASKAGRQADLVGEVGRQLALEWGESVVVAFILAMLIRTFLFQPYKIPSESMKSTLLVGDRLFVNKLAYGPKVPLTKFRIKGFAKPKRGDVIVFKQPPLGKKDFIKRLIAFGGETVEISDGHVLIDGKPVLDGPIGRIHYYNYGPLGVEGKVTRVPEGHYFVMGDNSASSSDSRYWGFVPEYMVVGRADILFWPPNRIGRIR